MRTMSARPLLWAVVGVAVGVFTIGMVWIAITTASTAHAIREGQINNKSTFNLIQDCVAPGTKEKPHQCFSRNQANQAQILGFVKIQQVAAVACADMPGTQSPEEINACVNRTMVKLGLPQQ